MKVGGRLFICQRLVITFPFVFITETSNLIFFLKQINFSAIILPFTQPFLENAAELMQYLEPSGVCLREGGFSGNQIKFLRFPRLCIFQSAYIQTRGFATYRAYSTVAPVCGCF